MVVAGHMGRQWWWIHVSAGRCAEQSREEREERLVKEGIAYVQMQETEDYLLVVTATVDNGTSYCLRRYNAVAGSVCWIVGWLRQSNANGTMLSQPRAAFWIRSNSNRTDSNSATTSCTDSSLQFKKSLGGISYSDAVQDFFVCEAADLLSSVDSFESSMLDSDVDVK